MLKNILNLNGVQKLDKNQQKNVNGGGNIQLRCSGEICHSLNQECGSYMPGFGCDGVCKNGGGGLVCIRY